MPIKAGEEKGKRSHGPSSKLVITALKTKNQYQLVPSKVDFDKGTGSLPTYFWIAGVPKEEDANMELAEWKLEGLVAIPYMKPKQQILEGTQLTYYKPAGEEGGPEKKAKK